MANHCKQDDGGFTLVEIVVVIAVVALLFQIVIMNLGAMIPARAMDSVAAQLVSRIDWLRSEARLQGKAYRLQLDLTNGSRYRIIVPAEDRLAASETATEPFDLGWSDLGSRVRLAGCSVAGGERFRSGMFDIVLDENGFTADLAIFLVHVNDDQMVWTLQVHGLTGQSEILRSFNGEYHPLEKMDEGRF